MRRKFATQNSPVDCFHKVLLVRKPPKDKTQILTYYSFLRIISVEKNDYFHYHTFIGLEEIQGPAPFRAHHFLRWTFNENYA